MPQDNSDINQKVATAKSVLAGAEKKFPSPKTVSPSAQAVLDKNKIKNYPPATAKPMSATEDTAAGLAAKSANVKEYMQNVPKMHKGGKVPGKPGEEVPIIAEAGETVIPADKSKGRQSEYRKVFVARRQSRQGGGNVPATGEKHDSKKAEKGIAEKKA